MLGFLLPSGVFAQKKFGLLYEAPADIARFQTEISKIKQVGFSEVIIRGSLTARHHEVLARTSLNIVHDTGSRFVMRRAAIPSASVADYSSQTQHKLLLGSYFNIANDRVFATLKGLYPQKNPDVLLVVSQTQLKPAANLSVTPVPRILSFTGFSEKANPENFQRLYYHPFGDSLDIRDFQKMMQSLTGDRVVWLDAKWLASLENKHLDIYEIIQAYAYDPAAVFPNPAEKHSTHSNHVIVLFFLLIWFVALTHSLLNPPYTVSLARYFTTHNFFLTDILERRIRFGASNGLLTGLFSFCGAVVVWVFYTERLSPLGQDALAWHLGLQTSPAGWVVFLIAFGAILLLIGLKLIWFYYTQPGMHFLSQCAVFIIWPLHFLLLISSFAMLIVLHGGASYYLSVALILTGILILGNFLFVSLDTIRISHQNLISIIAGPVLYMFVLLSVFLFLIKDSDWLQGLLLALRLG